MHSCPQREARETGSHFVRGGERRHYFLIPVVRPSARAFLLLLLLSPLLHLLPLLLFLSFFVDHDMSVFLIHVKCVLTTAARWKMKKTRLKGSWKKWNRLFTSDSPRAEISRFIAESAEPIYKRAPNAYQRILRREIKRSKKKRIRSSLSPRGSCHNFDVSKRTIVIFLRSFYKFLHAFLLHSFHGFFQSARGESSLPNGNTLCVAASLMQIFHFERFSFALSSSAINIRKNNEQQLGARWLDIIGWKYIEKYALHSSKC